MPQRAETCATSLAALAGQVGEDPEYWLAYARIGQWKRQPSLEISMRTDFTAVRVKRAIEHFYEDGQRRFPGQPLRVVSEDEAYEALTAKFVSFDWPERLREADIWFPYGTRGNEESFVVDDTSDPANGYLPSGSPWPCKYSRTSSAVNGREQVSVRSVGHGAKYAAAVKSQFLALGNGPADLVALEALIMDGSASSTRTRRVRARRPLASMGKEVAGTEMQAERTFVARTARDGLPLAGWKIGLKLFIAAARSIDPRDAVPVLEMEILDFWHPQRQDHPAEMLGDLYAAFRNLMQQVTVEAFMAIGPALDSDIDLWNTLPRPPYAISVRVPQELKDETQFVHDALIELFEDDGYSQAMCDSHAQIQWVEVICTNEPARARVMRSAQLRVALTTPKIPVAPGDEFVLVEVDVREFCISDEMLYFPASYVHDRTAHTERWGDSMEQFLALYGVKRNSTHDDRAVKDALRAAGEDPDISDLYYALRRALVVTRAGKVKVAEGLRLLVLLDKSTGAQAIELLHGNEAGRIEQFLTRSTCIPPSGRVKSLRPPYLPAEVCDAFDPGGLTLLVPPKRLLVARTLLEKRMEVGNWCDRAGVQIVHPHAGPGSVSSIPRVWRGTMAYYRGDERGQSVKGLTLDALAQHLLERCWLLNEVRPYEDFERTFAGQYLNQKGADVPRFRAWRAPLVAAAWANASASASCR